jgi:lipoic acid synthetase
VTPEEFKEFEKIGRSIGIDEVVAGPLVRSSYRAERAFYNYQKNQNDVS